MVRLLGRSRRRGPGCDYVVDGEVLCRDTKLVRITTSAALLRPRAGLAHAPINPLLRAPKDRAQLRQNKSEKTRTEPLPRTFQYVLREIRTHVPKHHKNAELVVFRHVAAKQDQQG